MQIEGSEANNIDNTQSARTPLVSTAMAERGVRQYLAGVFALHVAARLAMALMGRFSNPGGWLVMGLALIAAVQLLRVSGGRVAGMICLGLMTFRMVWMIADLGLPLILGAPWLASYLATAVALIAQGMTGASVRLARVSLVLVCCTLAWTIYSYASVIVAHV